MNRFVSSKKYDWHKQVMSKENHLELGSGKLVQFAAPLKAKQERQAHQLVVADLTEKAPTSEEGKAKLSAARAKLAALISRENIAKENTRK